MPVRITNYQLSLIRDAARNVPPEWRGRFLEAVVDQILPHPAPTDEAVEAAVSAVLGQCSPASPLVRPGYRAMRRSSLPRGDDHDGDRYKQ
jgi:hypothetical protein